MTKIDATRVGPLIQELMERVAHLEEVLGVRETEAENVTDGGASPVEELPALELQHRNFVRRLREQEQGG